MERSVAPAGGPSRNLNWTPAILGSLVATALSSILLAFGDGRLRHFVCRTDVAGRFRRAVDPVRSISHHPGSTELWGGRIHCRSHAGRFGCIGCRRGRTSGRPAWVGGLGARGRSRRRPRGPAWKRNPLAVKQQRRFLSEPVPLSPC